MSQPPQEQKPPGDQHRMDPRPDCGEQSYEGHGRLQGKVAVITGADSGIGRAVAIAYAREGADVLVSYLSEHEDAQDTARYVEEAGRRCVLVAGDVSDPQHCRDIIARTRRLPPSTCSTDSRWWRKTAIVAAAAPCRGDR